MRDLVHQTKSGYNTMISMSRRDLIKGALTVLPAMGPLGKSFAMTTQPKKSVRLADVGWTWEGQGFVGGAGLSIYGLGEGAEYFGLKKVFTLYRPNDELAMTKLRSFEEVICEISANRPMHCGERCVDSFFDFDPTSAKLLAEAKNVGEISAKYPNVKGGYIDDMLGKTEVDLSLGKSEPGGITADQYSSIYSTLKKANPHLKLWALVYSKQLYEQDWAGFKPHMEVINLWVWSEKDLRNLDRHVDRCHEIFPDKPISLGCFLWDYPSMNFNKGEFDKGHAVSMDLLKLQWESVLKYVASGKIDSYTILGAYLIDGAPEQARWVRDFIAAN